ncbi:MAG: hypothetical protein HY291_08375 [Planctomycetes bacterium]|nr:hypothetical protein [Planctomycetota bacterium]
MPAEQASQLGVRIAALEERLRGCLEVIGAAHEASATGEQARSAALQEGQKKLQEDHRQALEAHGRDSELAKEALNKELQRRTRRLWQAHERLRARIAHERQVLTDRRQKEVKEAEAGILAEETRVLEQVSELHNATLSEIASLREKAGGQKIRVKKLASAVGAFPEDAAAPAVPESTGDARADLDRVAKQLTDVAIECVKQDDSFLTTWSKRSRTVLAFITLAVLHIGAMLLMIQRGSPFMQFVYLGGSAAGSALLFLLVTSAVRPRAARIAQHLYNEVRSALAFLEAMEQEEKERFWAQSEKLVDKRIASLAAIDQKINDRDSAKVQANEAAMADCRTRHQRLKDRLQVSGERKREALERSRAANLARVNSEREADEKKLRAELAAAKANADQCCDKDTAGAAKDWKDSLDGFLKYGREAMASSLARHPAWDRMENAIAQKQFPADVRIGTLELPLRNLQIPDHDTYRLPDSKIPLPLALTFPGGGSLIVQGGGTHRDQALSILFNTTLRILEAFPPNMARLTILDPVGLGQAFSALMQLADFDEALIGGKIWSDAGHIEKRLAEKTEHIEGVIQNYLRNRYATLSEYNREAGEMKEPYHFILITDFPTGISDLAMERLASILSSGPRCGVHVLMYHDARQKWPESLDLAQVRRNGVILKPAGDGFTASHDGLDRGLFIPEKPPAIADVNRFLERAGKRAVDAKRVELSFSTVAPKPEEMWSRTTESSLRVPIGRSGAVRMQEMELGKGTAQHALIAGRTGSGKSTLFHVLITNTAMWFSPRDVEFYLIDFKKGVEFKAYATHRLPHARVIAVESDREFGLSVLKRLDRELDRRGELFRRAGVQDLASYRKSKPPEHLPRTLLLVDEFQEFFTEDDAVAQEAALLLDRFVRQGRAFGLHIILGSQTLSGVYTLAKSTLGQMGVRIALQCNEADSYLILSEDNAAARLLSRPGEAIYNDMSGLVEGNVPFQIVWLSGEQEAEYLRQIAAKAGDDVRAGLPTVVFEGNAPARLEQNQLLSAALEEKAPAERSALPVWLGEPNAIKNPTEARFTDAGGSHLLMLGQRKDAVLGMTSSMILSLAARLAPEQLRVLLLDGSGSDDEFALHLQKLSAALPHDVKLIPNRDVPDAIGELAVQIAAGHDEPQGPERHTFLFVLGLHRFKNLRQEDDFSLGSSREDGPSLGEKFASILREGPEHRIHTVVWCDTLANTNRALSRKTLREFDQRILFQMSAADSSELIDSPAANKLGLHSALLFVESDGILEKFRPYALPDEQWLQTFCAALQAKTTPSTPSGS